MNIYSIYLFYFLQLWIYISQFWLFFSELWNINYRNWEKKSQTCEIKRHNYLFYFLFMAKMSFHRFHMCKEGNHRDAQSSIHSSSSPIPLFLPCPDPTTPLLLHVPLPYPDIFFSLLLCVVLHPHWTNPIQRVLTVHVMKRTSTPDYASNWESTISQYFRDLPIKNAYQLFQYLFYIFFQYFWVAVVAKV